MTKEEILHLGKLSRVALSSEEVERLPKQIEAILDYVSTVKDIVGTEAVSPKVTPVHNVLREDVVTEVPGSYTESLLNSAPRRDGDFLVVNKILAQDE